MTAEVQYADHSRSARKVEGDNINMKPRRRLASRRRQQGKNGLQVLAVKALLSVIVVAWITFVVMITKRTTTTTEATATTTHRLPISSDSSKVIASGSFSNTNYESPLLIFTCKRPEYLKETLQFVLSTISQTCRFGCPIIVSEDGQHEEIKDVIVSFQKKFEEIDIPLMHIRHKKNVRSDGNAYKALAIHYGWALSQVFDGSAIFSNPKDVDERFLPQRVLILEEDIKVAPDFFSYMEATSSLLDQDPTLYAVSAFNDNGHLPNGDPKRILRSDFFPGLGWMMNRDLWKNELESKWPSGWWDDWLREPDQRKDRQVLRPEVSRTYHFGFKKGASENQFGEILKHNKLNSKAIRWDLEDLSYLENSLYEKEYTKEVMHSKLVASLKEVDDVSSESNVRIEYRSFSQFSKLARRLKIMDDEKAMVPRTAYKGIVEVRHGSSILFLTPQGGFDGYKKNLKKQA